MKQILIIIKREFFTRTRNKTFILFSIVSPLFFLIPSIFDLIAKSSYVNKNRIAVVDFQIKQHPNLKGDHIGYEFVPIQLPPNKIPLHFKTDDKLLGIIYISEAYYSDSFTPIKFYIKSEETPPEKIKVIENYVISELLRSKLEELNVNDGRITNLKQNRVSIILPNERSDFLKKISTSIAYFIGMLLYILYIIYTNALLRGILEEKTSRIVEVLSIIVDPFFLMIGKIIGIGLVAFIQMFIWVILFIIYSKVFQYIENGILHVNSANNILPSVLSFDNMETMWKIYIFTPIFFLFGFLLNGAVTAIIGSTSDSEHTSTVAHLGSFLNISSIYIAMFAAGNPEAILTRIAIYIPFFSPILVPTLLPYDIPLITIIISSIILIISFILLTFIASRIYRVSMVTHGTKISLRQILKLMLNRQI